MDIEKISGCSAAYQDEVARSLGPLGASHGLITELKCHEILRMARARLPSLENASALDVGCGIGLTDRLLVNSFAKLEGIDPSPAAIASARQHNPSVNYQVASGVALPHDDGVFDVAFTLCVLHHVEPSARHQVVREMARVVKPGGLVIVGEHNPWNPATRLAVYRCPLDEGAILLRRPEISRLLTDADLVVADDRFILLFPWRGPLWRRVEGALKNLPFGAQSLTCGVKPSDGAP